jgi:hypothetical protein
MLYPGVRHRKQHVLLVTRPPGSTSREFAEQAEFVRALEDEIAEFTRNSQFFHDFDPELQFLYGTEPFAEQVRLFAHAGLVVALAGAGLTNLIFAPPGAQALVLAAPNSYRWEYDSFATLLDVTTHNFYLSTEHVAGCNRQGSQGKLKFHGWPWMLSRGNEEMGDVSAASYRAMNAHYFYHHCNFRVPLGECCGTLGV